jgi:penicillin-binding protein 1A
VPQLATCVWVGYPKAEIPLLNIEGFYQVFGGSLPAKIWHDFMGPAVENMPVVGFPTPDLNGSVISGTGTYSYSQYPSSG